MEKRVRLKKILNLLFYCVDMDFSSNEKEKIRTKVIKRKVVSGLIF